jgi:protein SCO1/2
MKVRLLAIVLLLIATTAGAGSSYPSQSIYLLEAALTDQSGAQHRLDVYRDHPVLVTMFYGSCDAACPLLIDTVRSVERSLTSAQLAQVRVLMISIDPERDTTESLRALAGKRRIDLSRWTLAHTDAATVRKIAAVLNVQYRALPDGGFNHSSVITVLSPQGVILAQSSVLGKADPTLLNALTPLVSR